jgi:hypothetical protein
MADAMAGDASEVSGIYWNPSLLSFLRERSVIANYSLERIRGRDNIMNENVVFPLALNSRWSMGLGLTYSHVGRIDIAGPLSGYSYRQGSLDIAASVRISAPFSVGALTTIRYGRVESRKITTVSSVVGISYQPSPGIGYGLSYHGIGHRINYAFDTLTGSTSADKDVLVRSLEVGVTLRLNPNDEPPLVVASAGGQKNFGTDDVIYKGGIEVWPVDFLATRIGYWAGTQTVAGRYGGGLRIGPWRIDYGVSTTELEPVFHQLSLSFCFDRERYPR